MFYLYGTKNKVFYIFDNGNMFPFIIHEYTYKYDNLQNINQYKIIPVEDDIEKFKTLISEKTGVTVTDEELDNLKFANITK